MAKLKLDLHEIFNKGKEIDRALEDILEDAMERRIEEVEIKSKIHRIVKDSKNFGRIFVYFKFK